MIKKYRNGVIMLKPDTIDIMENGDVDENFYHHDMFMQDLYIEQLSDCDWYLVDLNKRLIYRLGSYLLQNPLKSLLEDLAEDGFRILLPEDPKESGRMIDLLYDEEAKNLLQD